jgi:hypothetical protein
VAQEATADSLFQEAAQLFARGEIKVACERFAASYKLDAAPGTLFNMAVCHERDGRLWRARGELLEFVDRAIKVGRPEKAQPAIEHVAAIEARLPRIQLVTPADGNVESISLDGVGVAVEDRNKPIVVDPDKPQHDLEFRGRGLVSRVAHVPTDHAATVVRVDVPVLTPEGTPVPAPGPGVPPPPGAPHPTRTAGLIVGGVGLAALGVGGIFGALTLSEKSAAASACPAASHVCTDPSKVSDAQGHHSTAETDSWVSTIGLGAGLVGVGVGAYLMLRHGTAESPSAIHVWPTVGRDGGGLTLGGPF